MADSTNTTETSQRSTPPTFSPREFALAGLLALAALIVALDAGGGAPQQAPAGIPDPGALTGWGLPVMKLVADLAALGVVGLLLTPTFLLATRHRELRGVPSRSVYAVRWVAVTWAAAVVVQLVLTVSDVLAEPVSDLSVSDVASFAWQVPQGRAMVVQAVLVAAVAVACRWVVTVREATLLFFVAVAALLPPMLTGHAASSGSHDLAIVSLMVHVVAASLWVGGLVCLFWITTIRATNAAGAVSRFSTLAAWCVAVIAVSGVISAAIRLGSWSELFTSGYGSLVLVKAAALVTLAFLGWLHRHGTVRELGRAVDAPLDWRAFGKLAGIEVAIMAATIGVAVALSRTPTPVGDKVYTSPVESLLGAPLPPAPNAARLVFGWTPSGVGLLVVLLGGALYAAGVMSMRRSGNSWPVGRTVSWFAGLLVVAWATFGGLGEYSHVLFSAHMVSHMLLSMVAPIFLVLAAPLTLALRTLPGPRTSGEFSPRHLLTSVLHSRVMRVLTHPAVATVLFIGSLYGLYFTGLFDTLMTNHLGHAAMELHFLLVGCLFFYVLIGVDPSPRRLPPFAALALLLIVMPFHAFFSIAIMSSSTVLGGDFFNRLNRPYSTDLLADQNLGGGVSWALGELPIIAVVAAIFVQWWRSDAREARRIDRHEDRSGDGESELERYNAYLAKLHAHDTTPDDSSDSN
jgi:cytochrome c oxidase assembly factor CtaG/putative copper export protein